MKANKFLEICKKCGALCCRVGGSTYTEEEKNRVLKAGYEDYFVEVETGFYETKCKNGRCPYLKENNSCEIQEVKPIVCVSYPIFPNFKGKEGYTLIECPLAKIMSKKEISKCKRDADKVSKKLMDVVLNYETIKNENERELAMKNFKKLGKQVDLE
ncbi:MAG: YkgJ family cysteine cluster protein [archaeon]